jgi:hypothetical protein
VNGKQEVDMHTDVQHDDWLYQQLQDAGFTAEYLNAASEDDDPKILCIGLAQGGGSARWDERDRPECRHIA